MYGKRTETRRHYSKLMSFAIIINDTAVLKRKNNWLNLFVWGWVNFLGDLNLIWILRFFFSLPFRFAFFSVVFSFWSQQALLVCWRCLKMMIFFLSFSNIDPPNVLFKLSKKKTWWKKYTNAKSTDESHILFHLIYHFE